MVLQMPPDLIARARRLAAGDHEWIPPVAVPAATVVLLRDGPAGLEVLLLRRPDTMAFAPGMHVFPGGRVDAGHDEVPTVTGWLPAGEWAEPALARALAVAAVRETFEEAGVLLAQDRAGRTPTVDEQWSSDRERSQTPGGFASLLRRRRLHIDADRLVPIAHWITPEVETRRYDTRFVVASLPDGQHVEAHRTEIAHASWVHPIEALARSAAGTMAMLPPTVAVLTDLSGQRSCGEALGWARGRAVVPLMPRARLQGETLVWELVHGRTGAVLSPTGQPAGSEEQGIR